MIDIHSHILPTLDDGSKSEEESLLMLKMAIEDGIRMIVATPHYNHRYANERSKILTEVNKLNKLIKENQLDIDILPGQEVRVYGELIDDYEAGKLLMINEHSNYMLIEFPSNHVPHYTERLLYEMELSGIKPVIAHPERNLELIKHPERLYNLVEKGALTQLTASSLTGFFGKEVQKFSKQLIDSNLIHTIATDAHNTTDRSFSMSQAYEVIIKRYGMSHVAYFKGNASSIITGEPVYGEQPHPVGRKKLFGFL